MEDVSRKSGEKDSACYGSVFNFVCCLTLFTPKRKS